MCFTYHYFTLEFHCFIYVFFGCIMNYGSSVFLSYKVEFFLYPCHLPHLVFNSLTFSFIFYSILIIPLVKKKFSLTNKEYKVTAKRYENTDKI